MDSPAHTHLDVIFHECNCDLEESSQQPPSLGQLRRATSIPIGRLSTNKYDYPAKSGHRVLSFTHGGCASEVSSSFVSPFLPP